MKHYESELAEDMYNVVKDINFGENRSIKPIVDQSAVDLVKNMNLPLDYRSLASGEHNEKSVFDGLAFDQDNIRTQSFSIFEGKIPIAIMSIVIAPKSWLEEQRYVQKQDNMIKIIDYKSLTDHEEIPDFCIIPGMTQVIDSHRNKLALPGFTAITNILKTLEEQAPENTYMEIVAQGNLEHKDKGRLEIFLQKTPVGTTLSTEEFPFDIKMIGENYSGSSSTVKIARLLKLDKQENIGGGRSLGPVFIKKLK